MGEIYNVGPEFSTPIREVVERAIKAMNLNFEDVCEITDDRLGQDSQYWLDSSKIKTQLGWEMKVFWDEGLTEMVDWGRRFYDAIRNYPVEYVMRG
jgi:dTDP-glucose 4,6-dehydratase